MHVSGVGPHASNEPLEGSMRHAVNVAALAITATMWIPFSGADTLRVGDRAPFFATVDEHMQLTDMADFIDGTPVVLLYGSAT